MTTDLLNNILFPTLMFEHDPDELEIYLSCLPLIPDTDVMVKAQGLAQQIYILSFLDDCVRRFMKTPYRYIEDLLAVVPDHFNPASKVREMVSPLLMTILEQLRAKILGELISTDAAAAIMAYLKRVLLCLLGKVSDRIFLEKYTQRLGEAVAVARENGQEREGLMALVEGMRDDLDAVFGKKGERHVVPEGTPESLVDES